MPYICGMRYIANILTKSKVKFGRLFNKTQQKETLIDGIPTLIIGWELTREIYPEADILDWRIDDTTYWTFGSRERRNVYEERLRNFTSMAIDRFSQSVRYRYVNLLTAGEDEKREIIAEIDSISRKVFFIKKDIVYLYGGSDTVSGFSLRDIRYEGKKARAILDRISSNAMNERIDESTVGKEITDSFRNRTYLIPALCF